MALRVGFIGSWWEAVGLGLHLLVCLFGGVRGFRMWAGLAVECRDFEAGGIGKPQQGERRATFIFSEGQLTCDSSLTITGGQLTTNLELVRTRGLRLFN